MTSLKPPDGGLKATTGCFTVSHANNQPSKAPFLQAVRVVILNAVVINQATVTRVLLRMQDTGVKVRIHIHLKFLLSCVPGPVICPEPC